MTDDLSVWAVQVGPTGLWDVGCCNNSCGWGMHTLAEDLATEAEAERVATRHRAEIRRAAKAEQVKADWREDALRQARTEAGRVGLVEELVAAKARIGELLLERDELLKLVPDREPENPSP